MNKKIGFIGQGWIGKNYADDFEERGHNVVRYAKEDPYINNKEAIADCDIVFIAVPTPTTKDGFDDSILRKVVPLVGKGKIAVIKSTLLPGTTESIQKENPDIMVVHSPEFLREVTAAYDARHPERNIVGIPFEDDHHRTRAKEVLSILPKAPYELVCNVREAETIKYASNCYLYTKVIFMNLLHDLGKAQGCDWQVLKDAMLADKRVGESHMDVIHQSGRGAGGHCFIKDFAAFREQYEDLVGDIEGLEALKAFERKNAQLLKNSGKDLDLLEGVYGGSV